MSDHAYQIFRVIGYPFRYRLISGDVSFKTGASIFVANHVGPVGPVQCVLSIPRRLYPWIASDMLDPERTQNRLLAEFITPVLHLNGKMGKFLAKSIARVTVPLLKSIRCIPVDRNSPSLSGLFRHSLGILKQGGALLIFPEDPALPKNPKSQLHPFLGGFLWLCYLYQQATANDLPVFPLVVCPERRTVVIGDPLYYQDTGSLKQDMQRLCCRLENRIAEIVLEGIDHPAK